MYIGASFSFFTFSPALLQLLVCIVQKATENDELKKKENARQIKKFRKRKVKKRKKENKTIICLLWILNCFHHVSEITSNTANIHLSDF